MNDTTQNESFKTNSGRNNTWKVYTHIMSSMFMTQSKTWFKKNRQETPHHNIFNVVL